MYVHLDLVMHVFKTVTPFKKKTLMVCACTLSTQIKTDDIWLQKST